MNWTKNLPTESGFYWYRDFRKRIVEAEIIEWDAKGGVGHFCGTDMPLFTKPMAGFEDMELGEFWPEKLEEPK